MISLKQADWSSGKGEGGEGDPSVMWLGRWHGVNSVLDIVPLFFGGFHWQPSRAVVNLYPDTHLSPSLDAASHTQLLTSSWR